MGKVSSVRTTVTATALALLAGAGCGTAQPELPEPLVFDTGPTARFVTIGDSGIVGTTVGDCDPATVESLIPPACRDALWASIRDEQPDIVFALGDLVYDFGPTCPDGLDDETRLRLDELVGDLQVAVDAPLVLAIGNHDVGGSTTGREAAERCYRDYAAERPGVFFPERNFIVRTGPATVAVLDTNRTLGSALAAEIAAAVDAEEAPWTFFAAHHVWKTYDDKVGEDHGPRWAEAIGVVPEVWLNGHAHLLQQGTYDGVLAVTSGASAKLRATTACGGTGDAAPCDREGLEFTIQRYGYAVVDVRAAALSVVFRDVTGATLSSTDRDR